jgi:hypothetical protein
MGNVEVSKFMNMKHAHLYGDHSQHKHRPNRAPRTETATITTNTEQAALSGPGDSLAAALIEATLDYHLARARLESVRRRLQAKGEAITSIGGGYFLRPTPHTTPIPVLFSRPEFQDRGLTKFNSD